MYCFIPTRSSGMIPYGYESITTPGVFHDTANTLVEFIWLNNDIDSRKAPWRGPGKDHWSKLVACVKKLMGPSFNISAAQLAFYIFRCHPVEIDSTTFAKAAVVAKKLFKKYDVEQLRQIYIDRRTSMMSSGMDTIPYKKPDTKNLIDFLKELEAEHGT